MGDPLGWRDLQSALSDTKDEILDAIGDVKRRLDDHDNRLIETEKKVDYFASREDGIRIVVRVLITLVAVFAGIVAIAKGIGVL